MRNDISLQNMISEISNRAAGRYNLNTDDDHIRQWTGFRHELLTEGGVLRLKRVDNPRDFWKTIVICLVHDPSQFHEAFSWVADIRDDLRGMHRALRFDIQMARHRSKPCISWRDCKRPLSPTAGGTFH